VNERHATSNLTPLMVASDLGHVDVVAALLDARAALEDAARFGETALLFAVLKSRESVVDALLGAGASLRARCVEGTPALAAAFKRNWPLAVRLLLLDTEFDAKDGVVMVRRAAKDSMAALDAVLATGRTFNLADALAEMCELGEIGAVRNLVVAGAQPQEALKVAAACGEAECVMILLAAGARPSSAMVISAAERNNTALVRLLLGAGAPWRPEVLGTVHMRGDKTIDALANAVFNRQLAEQDIERKRFSLCARRLVDVVSALHDLALPTPLLIAIVEHDRHCAPFLGGGAAVPFHVMWDATCAIRHAKDASKPRAAAKKRAEAIKLSCLSKVPAMVRAGDLLAAKAALDESVAVRTSVFGAKSRAVEAAHVQLGGVLRDLGDFRGAVELLRLLSPRSIERGKLAEALALAGEHVAARDMLERELADNLAQYHDSMMMEAAELETLLANVLRSTGELDRAGQLIESALGRLGRFFKTPFEAVYKARLTDALIRADAGDVDGAVRLLDDLLLWSEAELLDTTQCSLELARLLANVDPARARKLLEYVHECLLKDSPHHWRTKEAATLLAAGTTM
jgi:tetratricopeptide (TPR) repeat protein